MSLTNMKQAEKKQNTLATPEEYEEPKYPYGLSISLRNESIDKLGIKELPVVGSKVIIHAEAKVSEVSSRSINNKDDRSIEFQITDMSIDKKSNDKNTSEVLYGE